MQLQPFKTELYERALNSDAACIVCICASWLCSDHFLYAVTVARGCSVSACYVTQMIKRTAEN
eukprot:9057-Heterococcus_DN1.PRE.1